MLLLLVSPRLEFSTKVFVVVVAVAVDGVDKVIGGTGFFKFKFNGNGLFSLSKLRGNCIVVSSLIFVDDASTRFDDDVFDDDDVVVVVAVELFEVVTVEIDDEEF